MRTFTVYYFAALLTAGVLISNGRADQAEADPFGTAPSFREVSTKPIRSEKAVEVPDGPGELQPLRNEYARAAKQRSKLMDKTTLREAIDPQEKSIVELKAQTALEDIKQQLGQTLKLYSNTKAADPPQLLRDTGVPPRERRPDLLPTIATYHATKTSLLFRTSVLPAENRDR